MSAEARASSVTDGLIAQAQSIADGNTSSSQLIESAIERIEESQPTVNAFRVVLAERARQDAAEADRRIAAGERLPLLGVPVAVKDDTDIEGETTPFGCAGDFAPAKADARLVTKLRDAGAVIVGKTNAPEIGQWPVSDSKAFGIVRNPYNPGHTPGGSSGGSAAAVAAGLVAGAVGSDGGGSVHIPAGWSNLVGIKPSRGRISAFPVTDYGNGVSVHGPLARTVADAAALFDVLAGDLDPSERYHATVPISGTMSEAAERDPGKLRVAVVLNAPFIGSPNALDPGVKRAVLGIADSLAALGHEVDEYKLSYGPIGVTWLVRGSGFCRDWAKQNVPDISLLDPRTQAAIKAGAIFKPMLKASLAAEAPLAKRVGKVFEDYDVVLMPTTAEPPLRAGAIDGLGEMATNVVISRACPYTFAWNILGWPGVNVPAGLLSGNLPVGAQLLGRPGDEPQLVSLASQLEERERWYETRPDPAVYNQVH